MWEWMGRRCSNVKNKQIFANHSGGFECLCLGLSGFLG